MKNIVFPIESVQILVTNGTDIISLKLGLPSPFPNLGDPGFLEIKTAHGYAEEYCRDVLNIEPDEIIKVLMENAQRGIKFQN